MPIGEKDRLVWLADVLYFDYFIKAKNKKWSGSDYVKVCRAMYKASVKQLRAIGGLSFPGDQGTLSLTCKQSGKLSLRRN